MADGWERVHDDVDEEARTRRNRRKHAHVLPPWWQRGAAQLSTKRCQSVTGLSSAVRCARHAGTRATASICVHAAVPSRNGSQPCELGSIRSGGRGRGWGWGGAGKVNGA